MSKKLPQKAEKLSINKFKHQEAGANMIEYAIITGLCLLVLFVVFRVVLFNAISNSYQNNNKTFNTIGAQPLIVPTP